MSETVMLEAMGQGPGARAQAIEHVMRWVNPGVDVRGKSVVVLLGEYPPGSDLLEATLGSLSEAGRVDLAAPTLARYDTALREHLAGLLGTRGQLIDISAGQYEALRVPLRSSMRDVHGMQTAERRLIKDAYVARCLADADSFAVVRNLELNRFSGVHGMFATVLDFLATKTRAEVLGYQGYSLMGQALLDVWSAIEGDFLFGVLDGQQVREETFGKEAELGILLGGLDPAELDGTALIASGGRVSWSPFTASGSSRTGTGSRIDARSGIVTNIPLEDIRERMPARFAERPPARRFLGAAPVVRFTGRPADFDTLVCPTGAIEEGTDGIPVVRRHSCVLCGWCLKQYAEATTSPQQGRPL